VAELKAEVDKGAAVIVDVRSKEQYKTDHIKGAINIPGNEITTRAGELPRDKMIVTYCSWPSEQTSARAVQDLKAKGMGNAAALFGGTEAWRKAGLPMETGEKAEVQ
jgi:rhodanese-related sulfurtransferase